MRALSKAEIQAISSKPSGGSYIRDVTITASVASFIFYGAITLQPAAGPYVGAFMGACAVTYVVSKIFVGQDDAGHRVSLVPFYMMGAYTGGVIGMGIGCAISC